MSHSEIISQDDVRHVAALARIHLDDTQIQQLTVSLESILEYVAQLKNLDTKDIHPTSHPLTMENVYRPDVRQPGLTQEEALSFAVEKKNGFFKVPKVIE